MIPAVARFRLFGQDEHALLAECASCKRVLRVPRDRTSEIPSGFVVSPEVRCPCGQVDTAIPNPIPPPPPADPATARADMRGVLLLAVIFLAMPVACLVSQRKPPPQAISREKPLETPPEPDPFYEGQMVVVTSGISLNEVMAARDGKIYGRHIDALQAKDTAILTRMLIDDDLVLIPNGTRVRVEHSSSYGTEGVVQDGEYIGLKLWFFSPQLR